MTYQNKIEKNPKKQKPKQVVQRVV